MRDRGIYITLLVTFLVVLSTLPGNSLGDEIHTTSYTDSVVLSLLGRGKAIPNALDSNNGTAAYVEANRCDGGSATCSSGQTFIHFDLEVQMSSNTTRADVRWAMIAPESLPAYAKGAISVYNYESSTWSLVVEDTTNNGQQMVEEIILNPANLDGSNNATFRFSVYHNGSDFPSDELVLYVYTIYDVREDITDSDGDGIDDEFDTCPNGETGWTSTTN